MLLSTKNHVKHGRHNGIMLMYHSKFQIIYMSEKLARGAIKGVILPKTPFSGVHIPLIFEHSRPHI